MILLGRSGMGYSGLVVQDGKHGERLEEELEIVRLGPGNILTGWCRRACDGAVVELQMVSAGRDLVVEKAILLEIHDINLVDHHTERETAWFLKRCVSTIEQEGLTLIIRGDVYTITPDKIDTSQTRYQQFLSPGHSSGPFNR